MKIDAIETLRLEDHPNLVWVRIHTDSGLTGLGETYFGAGPIEATRPQTSAESAVAK